jgi:hypothetical protein
VLFREASGRNVRVQRCGASKRSPGHLEQSHQPARNPNRLIHDGKLLPKAVIDASLRCRSGVLRSGSA